jgi:hypothetical protein
LVIVWDQGDAADTSDFVRGLSTSLPPSMEVLEKVVGVKLRG